MSIPVAPTMTAADAEDEIRLFTEAGTAPLLTDGDIAVLMRKAKRYDINNRPPSDPAWIPAWDLAYAIAMGWQLKASRCVNYTDFSAGQQKISRSQRYKQCVEMMKYWKKFVGYSHNSQGPWRRRTIMPGTVPGVQSNGILEDDYLF